MAELANPANNVAAAPRKRIPMSAPQQKLAVPEIPGYYLYWVRGTPERLQQAINGGYEFVHADDTRVTDTRLGGDAKHEGSTDLGTRVSVLAGAGEVGADNQPIRLYLMKLKEELHQEDLISQSSQSEALRKQLLSGQVGADQEASGDRAARYVGRQTSSNMFQPKPIRRS